MAIYLTHEDGRRTVADDDEMATRFEARGFKREDANEAPKPRKPRVARAPKTEDE